jgi:hypothetical protein
MAGLDQKSNREEEKKMNKQWESERSRIEHADDAKITFTHRTTWQACLGTAAGR